MDFLGHFLLRLYGFLDYIFNFTLWFVIILLGCLPFFYLSPRFYLLFVLFIISPSKVDKVNYVIYITIYMFFSL